MRVAQLHEARGLVGGSCINRARQMQRVVGQQAHGAAFDAGQRGVDAKAETRAQLQQRACICNAVQRRAAVVHAQAVLGHHAAQSVCIRRLPLHGTALKKREVILGGLDGLRVALHQQIDHAIGMLHMRRADLLGLEHAQATALHHGGAAHADVAVFSRDDHIATAQQGRIARKAAARSDAHRGHMAVQAGEAGKGTHMQARHDGHVHIARPAASALGPEHHGPFVFVR